MKGYDILQMFKDEADQIRKDIDLMMNNLVEKTEQVQDELSRETRSDYKSLKAAIKIQKDENELLYKNLGNLAKDNISAKRKVIYLKSKIEELEQHVGIIDTNFLPTTHHNQVDNEWDVDTMSKEANERFKLDVENRQFASQEFLNKGSADTGENTMSLDKFKN